MDHGPVRQYQHRKDALNRLARYLHVEALSGIVLLLAAGAALLWANSPYSDAYQALRHAPLSIGIDAWRLSRPLEFWINDALMTFFFLVVGMEIRREMHEGALRNPRQALLPIAAAMGGVVVPALLYLALTLPSSTSRGWAVPTATDIAFAVGVLALLGRSMPPSLRILLLTLAIIDDLIAVSIIAVFYSDGLQFGGFAIVGLGCGLVLVFQRLRIASAWAYLLPGAIVWGGMLMTGAHPTLAGVLLGLLTPVSSGPRSPVVQVASALHPWVAYGVMPLFALANAGVTLGGSSAIVPGTGWVTAAVSLALLVGKPLGVVGASWMVVRLGACKLPADLSWRGIWLLGLLAGIGFTMSIFIANLAFLDAGEIDAAKRGVLAGSFASGILAVAWGWRCVATRP